MMNLLIKSIKCHKIQKIIKNKIFGIICLNYLLIIKNKNNWMIFYKKQMIIDNKYFNKYMKNLKIKLNQDSVLMKLKNQI